LESELFGHVRGAFTGADRERKGLFAAADGGTLFLDEIGELPLELQPKLLRVLQEGEIRRVGENRPSLVNVRVLAATARNLQEEVENKRFRDDLFYRLAVVEIDIPPLKERREDIPLLAGHFLARIAEREGRPVPTLTSEVKEVLVDYGWPGNVRELENFMEKTMIFCREDRIELSCLPWEFRRQSRGDEDFSLKAATERLEREYIRKALDATGGNRTQAARLLEISLRALQYKIKELDLN
jgi:two-component system response regulator AtoC